MHTHYLIAFMIIMFARGKECSTTVLNVMVIFFNATA